MRQYTELLTLDGAKRLLSGANLMPEFQTAVPQALAGTITSDLALEDGPSYKTRRYRLITVEHAEIYVYEEVSE